MQTPTESTRTFHFAKDDYIPPFEFQYPEVYARLRALSTRLLDQLPDPSIGPEERLERIARVVPSSIRVSSNLLTGYTKLVRLRSRLDELVPGEMDELEKLEVLLARVHELVPGDMRLIEKLETMHDYRYSDTGTRARLPEALR
ncbi:hypothetical protein [Leifsonia sp. NPDC077715]|uniref:hypothetical protein n=1 Tax=Leifsonia sp. NPDC077715 TaxID=3155539 RepID=UPI00344A09AC